MSISVEQLAQLVGGSFEGDANAVVHEARGWNEAGPGHVTFIENDRIAREYHASNATAALVGPHFAVTHSKHQPSLIRVSNPREAFMRVREHFAKSSGTRWSGVHDLAHVSPSAKLGPGVAIHPFASVGDEAEIGENTTIHAGVVVGPRCQIGRDSVIRPNCVLYEGSQIGDRVELHAGAVIGADGFGYRQENGRHVKVPQTGVVEIGDDVEIGANSAIDRGTFGATRIGAGTKIDNLVQIGHNNVIGRHNMICGQVGIAGSCSTGDYVVMGGQVGLKDHLKIGAGAQLAAQSGLIKDLPPGARVFGTPAIDAKEELRLFVLKQRLPQLFKTISTLAETVDSLNERIRMLEARSACEASKTPEHDRT